MAPGDQDYPWSDSSVLLMDRCVVIYRIWLCESSNPPSQHLELHIVRSRSFDICTDTEQWHRWIWRTRSHRTLEHWSLQADMCQMHTVLQSSQGPSLGSLRTLLLSQLIYTSQGIRSYAECWPACAVSKTATTLLLPDYHRLSPQN